MRILKIAPYHGFAILFLLLLISPKSIVASDVNKGLKDLVNQLTKGFPFADDAPRLAILSLNTSPALTRKNIGFAFSEVLTHEVLSRSKFRVIERLQLNEVMKEQKFQLTGAVDSKAAVEIGKILDARYVVVGSVEKGKGTYQVNARIADVQSAEVLSSGFVEIPSDEFDEIAAPYLKIVPERQKIGIFGVTGIPLKSESLPSTTFVVETNGAATVTHTVVPKQIEWSMSGVGVRYFPMAWLYVEGAYLFIQTDDKNIASVTRETHNGSDPNLGNTQALLNADHATRYLIGLNKGLGRHFSVRLAGGFQKYNIDAQYEMQSGIGFFVGSEPPKYKASKSSNNPYASLGLDYKIQSRLHLSINAGYEFGDVDLKLNGYGNPTLLRLQRYSIEPMLSLYF